jgi:flagellar FliL protein
MEQNLQNMPGTEQAYLDPYADLQQEGGSMATAEAQQDTATQGKKSSFGKKLFLILNGVIFLAGIAFFLLTKFGMLPGTAAKTAPTPAATAEQATATEASRNTAAPGASATEASPDAEAIDEADLVMVQIFPFVVNLSGDNGQRYLRIAIQVAVYGKATAAALDKHMTEARNRLLFLLSSKTFAEIGTVQGKYNLQAEISQHLNELLGGKLVGKAYFTEFIVQ